MLIAHVTKTPPPLRSLAPDVRARLADVVDRCLAKDPAARFQSGAQFARELAEIEAEMPGVAVESPRVVVSDSDAQRIWGRAAELQEATSSQPMPALPPATARPQEAPTSGYSLSDVRGSAREAGIATKAIDRALAEYGLAPSGSPAPTPATIADLSAKKGRFAGDAGVIEYEVVVDGEVSEHDFDVLGDVIRQRMSGDAGTLTAVGRSLNWSSSVGARRLSVTIVARRGKTTIRVTENLAGLEGRVLRPDDGCRRRRRRRHGIRRYHGARTIRWPRSTAWLGTVATSYGVARSIFVAKARDRREKLRAMVDALAHEVRESIAGR